MIYFFNVELFLYKFFDGLEFVPRKCPINGWDKFHNHGIDGNIFFQAGFIGMSQRYLGKMVIIGIHNKLGFALLQAGGFIRYVIVWRLAVICPYSDGRRMEVLESK